MKKVSVIIPVYNVEKYIELCLSTVLNQSYMNIEVILIDDGSLDQSAHITEYLLLQDSRVKVIHQTNQGAAYAKNIGLDCVTGDYVAFLDSDDTVSDNWLEKMIFALENNESDISECCFDKEFTNRVVRETLFQNYQESFDAETYLSFYLSDWTCSLFWNKLFKADLLRSVRFHNERRCIDDEFFTYKALSQANTITRINEVLYHYRQRLSGAVFSNNHQIQITHDAIDVLKERYQWILQRYPKLCGVYYSHDVAIMNYFANDFNFDEDAVNKFLRTRRYYVLNCFHNLSKQNIKNLLRLLFVKKKLLLSSKPQNAVEDKENYFV